MKLLVFAASHRLDSFNRKLAKLAATHMAAKGATIDFAEYGEFDMPIYNDASYTKDDVPDIARSFAKRAGKADGIILSSPEYNWSYPGSLKNILDWTSRLKPAPLTGKAVFLMSATPGSRGGIVGLTHLKLPIEALHMFVYPKMFPLGHAELAFDASGNLADAKQQQAFTLLLDGYRVFVQKFTG
jgi:NAD(P)H-dependent FMN reductase